MTNAAELYALQEIDLAIGGRTVRLVTIEQQLEEPEELIAARQQTAEKQEGLEQPKEEQKGLERRVGEVRGKATQIEARLYGGSIRNPKELQDLQADLNALQSQVRRREDELLTLMMQVEEAEAELRAAGTALATAEDDWQGTQTALLAEKSRLEGEVTELEDRRRRQAGHYRPGELTLYDLLRERKEGRAVAKVEQGMCGGCHITLPMSLLQKTRTGLGTAQCPRCERILYVS
jgi:predicted  nucleic acid-binding Zn-ribbon protein